MNKMLKYWAQYNTGPVIGTINNSSRKRNKRNRRVHCLSTINNAATQFFLLLIPTFAIKNDTANDKLSKQFNEFGKTAQTQITLSP